MLLLSVFSYHNCAADIYCLISKLYCLITYENVHRGEYKNFNFRTLVKILLLKMSRESVGRNHQIILKNDTIFIIAVTLADEKHLS